MIKEIIKNRKGEKIVTLVEESEENKGLGFIMHGMGYNKNEPCVATVAESFRENGYTVARFDTTHTFGESNGKFENATFTNYYEDLEDVINWGSKNKWYKEPFVMAGQSIGGLCTMLFAEEHPSKVKAIAPISTIISCNLALEAYPIDVLKKWEEDGIYEWENEGEIKKMKWACAENGLKYNVLENISSLTMPVLIIVGENDKVTPVNHQKILYQMIPGKKDLKIIKGASHMFKEKAHLDEIRDLLDKWIKTL